MGTHRHRRHSTELKLRLVQVYLSGEASLNGLARELDISRNLIRVWADKFHKGELSEKVDRAEKVREFEVKIAALAYREKLGELGIPGSMSRKGNRCDNALAESFMKTLKHEEILACEYETMSDVIGRLPRFIEEVHNRRRLHSSNGYLPPEEYELDHARQVG
ncbi:MAG: transposase [Deltaproteobacteria bacterium]|nr:transposase [Deltaproteobacteria bacterium]